MKQEFRTEVSAAQRLMIRASHHEVIDAIVIEDGVLTVTTRRFERAKVIDAVGFADTGEVRHDEGVEFRYDGRAGVDRISLGAFPEAQRPAIRAALLGWAGPVAAPLALGEERVYRPTLLSFLGVRGVIGSLAYLFVIGLVPSILAESTRSELHAMIWPAALLGLMVLAMGWLWTRVARHELVVSRESVRVRLRRDGTVVQEARLVSGSIVSANRKASAVAMRSPDLQVTSPEGAKVTFDLQGHPRKLALVRFVSLLVRSLPS